MKLNMLLSVIALVGAVSLMKLFAQEAAPAVGTNEVAAVQEGAAGGEDAAAAAEAPKEISALDQWTTYIKQGGNTMWFIGILSILGVGCALERLWNLRRSRIVPDGFTAKVITLWRAGKLDEVESLAAGDRSMLARVVETLLEHRASTDYGEVKQFAEDKAGRELRLENRKSSMLSTVATISPLLGLFGTVVGLLGAFGTVAAMGEMGDASVLADDIGKALITTVAGLAVSIPSLFVYNVLKNRLNLFAVVLEEEVADLVNRIFVDKRA